MAIGAMVADMHKLLETSSDPRRLVLSQVLGGDETKGRSAAIAYVSGLYRQLGTLGAVAAELGIDLRTLARWRSRHPDLKRGMRK